MDFDTDDVCLALAMQRRLSIRKQLGYLHVFYLALASRIETHCHCYAVAQSPIVRHGNTVVNYLLRLPMPD